MKWHFVEMHCHTLHSDGSFSPEDLAQNAREDQLDGIALTDHNTMSGHKWLAKTGLPFIPGIEWTTFFGHMLVLGAREYVDWRDATPENIDEKMIAVHRAGGLVGVAHPFDLGSPMCTGCYWDFQVRDWHNVDYIEVWHGAFPPVQWKARRAKALWLAQLDKGCRIAPMYGRDWHGRSYAQEPFGVTMLGMESAEFGAAGGYEAVQKGRVMLTLGFGAGLWLERNMQRYELGDTIQPGEYTAHITLDMQARSAVWQRFDIVPLQAVFYGPGEKQLACVPLTGEETVCSVPAEEKYVRMELLGTAMGKACTVAVSAPFYIGKEE